MRFLLPEIASSIGFCITVVLFVGFAWIINNVYRESKVNIEKYESLPLEED